MKRVLMSLIILASVVGFTVTSGFAGGFLYFTESYQQQVNCSREGGRFICDVEDSGSFKVFSQVSLDGLDISQFNGSTRFYLRLKDFRWDAVLGDDPNYKPGATRARLVLPEAAFGDRRAFKYLTALLTWNSNHLTITLNGKTPAFLNPIAAGSHIGDETGFFSETSTGTLQFADGVFFDVDLSIKGHVQTRDVRRRGQDFSLSQINLIGLGTEAEERPR